MSAQSHATILLLVSPNYGILFVNSCTHCITTYWTAIHINTQVGDVTAPPFTTTPSPSHATPYSLPSSPPALYPSWFAPAPKDIMTHLKLPKGFKFGVATAAYQVEGAVKNEGKGPTHWDWAGKQIGAIADNTTGQWFVAEWNSEPRLMRK